MFWLQFKHIHSKVFIQTPNKGTNDISKGMFVSIYLNP